MNQITLEDFKRLDIRVGRIKEARRIEGADRLLLLEVDLGAESRQLVAGIAENHDPEALVGVSIVVLANLKPAVIRGHESQGMLLAASDPTGKAVLLVPEADVPPGARVS